MLRDSNDSALMSATGLVGAYHRHTLSPVEVVTAVLHRIATLNPRLNAFCLVDEEGAKAAAAASAARWKAGRPLGLLDGVPVTIKDLLLTKGWPTMRGSKLVDPKQACDEDAPAVARLKEHGAILLGKTTTPEFGWKALSDSPLTGLTRNPWNVDCTAGGSSSGAAVAAATGMGALHIGTDGGGSIRIPAAFCGVVGLKPTFGRVPAYPPSTSGTLAHFGPITRSVADAALMLTVLAEPDSRDPLALPPQAHDFRVDLDEGVRGLRIAWATALPGKRTEPEVQAAIARAALAFAELGATVEETAPDLGQPHDAFLVLWTAALARLARTLPQDRLDELDPGLRRDMETGAQWSAVDLLEAEAARLDLGRKMAAFHERYDLLLTPTVPRGALPLAQDLADPATERHWIDWTPFSYPFNMTRQPAITLPCGVTSEGLPIGLQLVGKLYDDALVLRAAHAFEASWRYILPPLLDRP